MGMTDPLADMLTRMRNANKAKHEKVDIPASNLKAHVARILKDEGYIKNYKVIKDGKQGILRIYLKYEGETQEAGHLRAQDREQTGAAPVCAGRGHSPGSPGTGRLHSFDFQRES